MFALKYLNSQVALIVLSAQDVESLSLVGSNLPALSLTYFNRKAFTELGRTEYPYATSWALIFYWGIKELLADRRNVRNDIAYETARTLQKEKQQGLYAFQILPSDRILVALQPSTWKKLSLESFTSFSAILSRLPDRILDKMNQPIDIKRTIYLARRLQRYFTEIAAVPIEKLWFSSGAGSDWWTKFKGKDCLHPTIIKLIGADQNISSIFTRTRDNIIQLLGNNQPQRITYLTKQLNKIYV